MTLLMPMQLPMLLLTLPIPLLPHLPTLPLMPLDRSASKITLLHRRPYQQLLPPLTLPTPRPVLMT